MNTNLLISATIHFRKQMPGLFLRCALFTFCVSLAISASSVQNSAPPPHGGGDSLRQLIVLRQGIDSLKMEKLRNAGVEFRDRARPGLESLTLFSEVVVKGRVQNKPPVPVQQTSGRQGRARMQGQAAPQSYSVEIEKIYKNASLLDTALRSELRPGDRLLVISPVRDPGQNGSRRRGAADQAAETEGLFFLNHRTGTGGYAAKGIFLIDNTGNVGYYTHDAAASHPKFARESIGAAEDQIMTVLRILGEN
ncbi:MAG TPA: hypothetical protein VMW43_03860 [Bacteroidota bacterium]|nr:hypothetical protein [Bacteroidota bacterium]